MLLFNVRIIINSVFLFVVLPLLFRFLERTHKHTHKHPVLLLPSDQLVADAGTYFNTQDNRRSSMPSVGFKPAILAIKRLHVCALDRTATEIS